ncbi:hypothetical protein EV193_1196 [Herbihabitans rhizosphaerae]|uniref:Putative T7SS secretion signal domain-containing protein n=1 Tax=Herbihabitans rhizosphaerae TaxID=1872711 RepID=A0A4Q7KBB6_9PSEU|nr:hypothetical protein [Herbihabitans rhizosphaerae]RZS29603.1 hypothetical protein EV193_1196 [Herbihabitans rhizosphaerae]
MAELGQTENPKELIPGEPAEVTAVATALRVDATTMLNVSGGLGQVTIPSWTGDASGQFWGKFSPEKNNWKYGHDELIATAGVVDSQATTLTWAQGQAGEAIAQWKTAQQATTKAIDDFMAKGGEFHPGLNPYAPVGSPGGPCPLTPGFTDPGVAGRAQAQATLARARQQLKDASTANATAIGEHSGKGKNTPDWLASPANFVAAQGVEGLDKTKRTIKESKSWAEQAQARQDRHNDPNNPGKKLDKYSAFAGTKDMPKLPGGTEITLVAGLAEANLFKTEAQGATTLGTPLGDLNAEGKATLKAGNVTALGTAGFNGMGASASGLLGAYAVDASARGQVSRDLFGVTRVEVGGGVRGAVGAELGGTARIGAEGVNVGANAFAGGKIVGDAHVGHSGVEAGARAEGWAGIGASADATFGKTEDGKWKIGANAGAAIGLGGKLGAEFTVDPGEVGNTAKKVASKLNPFD